MRRLQWICAMSVLVLMGCAGIAVQYDYDPDVDFTRYKTFSWMPMSTQDSGARENLSGPFIEKRIRKSLAEGLTTSGLRYVRKGADVLVAYQLRYERKSEVRVGGYGAGYIHAPYPYAVDVRKYREGTLIVDLVDPETKELIWRGWSVSDLHRAVDPQQEQEKIAWAVRTILEHYPPY